MTVMRLPLLMLLISISGCAGFDEKVAAIDNMIINGAKKIAPNFTVHNAQSNQAKSINGSSVSTTTSSRNSALVRLQNSINAYAEPHGITADVHTGSPLPMVTFSPYKSPNPYDDISLMIQPVSAAKASDCLNEFGRDYYRFKDAKKITTSHGTYYKHVDKGVKFTSNLYYTYNNGVCFVLEGDADLRKSIPANKNLNMDTFYINLLKRYQDGIK